METLSGIKEAEFKKCFDQWNKRLDSALVTMESNLKEIEGFLYIQ